jgi:hypothetical protein
MQRLPNSALAHFAFAASIALGSAALVAPAWSQTYPAEELFVVGTDSQVYAQKLDANGNRLGGYFLVQAGQVKALATVDTTRSGLGPLGVAEIFVIGTDNQVYFKQFDFNGDSVTSYTPLPGQVKAIAAVASVTGSGYPSVTIQLFVIGTDSQVYVHQFDGNGNPAGGYFPIPGVFVKAIAVGQVQSGSPPLLFVIGTDNQVYMHQFDVNGNPVRSYTLVGCPASGVVPCPIKAITAQTGNPVLLATGTDQQVWVQRFDANANRVGGFEVVGTPGVLNQVKAVSVSSMNPFCAGCWPLYNPADKPLLFVIGTDNQVYEHLFDSSGNPLGSYVQIPDGINAIYAHHELFVIGTDQQVWMHRIDQFGNPVGGYINIPNQVKAIGGEVFLPLSPLQ